ncbi:hypothetical protein CDAR_108091 [Caerostris darwini]|uniref:Uncharacterized protein n=1 Tax=Caerostris darwini TaxID=1538125 RepID=A0AAV4X4H8_9ARAC|nr:hypothetical protein CDAR_108091 [Caerostris darwini]
MENLNSKIHANFSKIILQKVVETYHHIIKKILPPYRGNIIEDEDSMDTVENESANMDDRMKMLPEKFESLDYSERIKRNKHFDDSLLPVLLSNINRTSNDAEIKISLLPSFILNSSKKLFSNAIDVDSDRKIIESKYIKNKDSSSFDEGRSLFILLLGMIKIDYSKNTSDNDPALKYLIKCYRCGILANDILPISNFKKRQNDIKTSVYFKTRDKISDPKISNAFLKSVKPMKRARKIRRDARQFYEMKNFPNSVPKTPRTTFLTSRIFKNNSRLSLFSELETTTKSHFEKFKSVSHQSRTLTIRFRDDEEFTTTLVVEDDDSIPEQYDTEEHNIQEHYDTEEHNIQVQYGTEEHNIQEQYGTEEHNIQELYDTEEDNTQVQYGTEEHNIQEQYDTEKHNIQVQYGTEEHNIQEQYDTEEHNIQEQYDTEEHNTQEQRFNKIKDKIKNRTVKNNRSFVQDSDLFNASMYHKKSFKRSPDLAPKHFILSWGFGIGGLLLISSLIVLYLTLLSRRSSLSVQIPHHTSYFSRYPPSLKTDTQFNMDFHQQKTEKDVDYSSERTGILKDIISKATYDTKMCPNKTLESIYSSKKHHKKMRSLLNKE